MSKTLARRYTLVEYRDLEETALVKHEYHQGDIVAVTGGTIEHSGIAVNILALLKTAYKNTLLKPYGSDLRVWIPEYQRGLYPDVMAIAGEPEFNEQRRDEILNPKLIVEILSSSTEAYDRGDKFRYYRALPSFTEYLLVSQDEPLVDQCTKVTEREWLMKTHAGRDAVIRLETGNIELAVTDIYEGIVFSGL